MLLLLVIGRTRTVLPLAFRNARSLLLHRLLYRRDQARRTVNAAVANQLAPRRDARDVLVALHRPHRRSLSGREPTRGAVHTVGTRADLGAPRRDALELFCALGLDRLLVADDALAVTLGVADDVAWVADTEVFVSLFGCC